jgi:nucleotide-binding universal stress UspA family protein
MNPIVVGVDGSVTAKAAAKRAAEVANALGAPLHIVMAVSATTGRKVSGGSDSWHVDSIGVADEVATALAGELGVAEVTHAVVVAGPAEALCDEAARLDAEMIVVGNKRVQGAARVLGSIAGSVARQAPCDVLIVHTT